MMAAKTDSLNLLQAYDSSSDTDEDDRLSKSIKRAVSAETDCQPSKKPCVRLPVPQALTSMFAKDKYDETPRDDPAQHDGRIRSFPHERGNWSTLVYIPFLPDAPEPWSTLTDLLATWDPRPLNVIEELPHLNPLLRTIDEPHLSLSRTVVLRHHWIDSFISDLRSRLHQVPSFHTCLSRFKVYTNDEKSRTFLGLEACVGKEELKTLSELTDCALAEFSLPPFYQESSFHVSVAWCLGDWSELLTSSLPALEALLEQRRLPTAWPLSVSHVCCRTGNKLSNLPLSR